MTLQTKAAWISGGFLFIPPFLIFVLCEIYGSKVITMGETAMPFGLLCFLAILFILKLIFIVAGIAFVVQGFRVHWGWGLANLFVPFAFIAFSVIHRRAARVPVTITFIGVGWILLLLILWVMGKT